FRPGDLAQSAAMWACKEEVKELTLVERRQRRDGGRPVREPDQADGRIEHLRAERADRKPKAGFCFGQRRGAGTEQQVAQLRAVQGELETEGGLRRRRREACAACS